MSRFTHRTFLVVVAALLGAALAFTASPASASQSGCADGYDVYVLNPLTDALLLGVDFNGDAILCVANGNREVASVGDNSDLGALLPAGILDGFTLVDSPITIGDVSITAEDILTADNRGNRNSVVTAGFCQNTNGPSCLGNSHMFQNVKIVLIDDVLPDML